MHPPAGITQCGGLTEGPQRRAGEGMLRWPVKSHTGPAVPWGCATAAAPLLPANFLHLFSPSKHFPISEHTESYISVCGILQKFSYNSRHVG